MFKSLFGNLFTPLLGPNTGSGGIVAALSKILLENGDALLMETGDCLFME